MIKGKILISTQKKQQKIRERATSFNPFYPLKKQIQRSPRFKIFDSGRNSRNPALRPNLRPNLTTACVTWLTAIQDLKLDLWSRIRLNVESCSQKIQNAPIPTIKIRQKTYYTGFMNSTLWKIICNLNPKAQAVIRPNNSLRPESYFLHFLNRQLRSPKIVNTLSLILTTV